MAEQKQTYLGSNLRLLIAAYGMTHKSLAERAGIDQSYVSRLTDDSKEESRRTTVEKLAILADIFDTDLETLVRKDLVGELKAKIKKDKSL